MSNVAASAASPSVERPAQVGDRGRRSRARQVEHLLLRYGMVLVLVALVLAAQALYPGFLAVQNVENILSQNAPLGLIAVGMTFVMITGGFDLSVGALYAAGATVYASLAVKGVPLVPAAGVTLALGLLAGGVNGLIVTRLRVNPFVATLGTASVFAGGALLYSNSSPFAVADPGFTDLGRGQAGGIPYSVLCWPPWSSSGASCCPGPSTGEACTHSAATGRRRAWSACAWRRCGPARTSWSAGAPPSRG
jgi:predicted ABC-type sugar transport system permease subunit